MQTALKGHPAVEMRNQDREDESTLRVKAKLRLKITNCKDALDVNRDPNARTFNARREY